MHLNRRNNTDILMWLIATPWIWLSCSLHCTFIWINTRMFLDIYTNKANHFKNPINLQTLWLDIYFVVVYCLVAYVFFLVIFFLDFANLVFGHVLIIQILFFVKFSSYMIYLLDLGSVSNLKPMQMLWSCILEPCQYLRLPVSSTSLIYSFIRKINIKSSVTERWY